jgi:hypothetical protein
VKAARARCLSAKVGNGIAFAQDRRRLRPQDRMKRGAGVARRTPHQDTTA